MEITQQEVARVITLAAVALFAVTGVLAGLHNGADIFSLVVFGVVTAIGGGTIRDLLLNIDVFWVSDLAFVWAAVGGSIVGFLVYRSAHRAQRALLYLDAIGVSLFTVQAINKVLGLSYSPTVALIMGVITGIGGGLIRDVLTDRPTLLMTKELYATPILIGGVVYIGLLQVIPESAFSWIIPMVVIFGLRAAAIHWELALPSWLAADTGSQDSQP